MITEPSRQLGEVSHLPVIKSSYTRHHLLLCVVGVMG